MPKWRFFTGGTLFDHVKPGMRFYKEEIFGPMGPLGLQVRGLQLRGRALPYVLRGPAWHLRSRWLER
jgi:hypothetical protein